MPKHRKKGDLPEKDCLHCGRPFTWRKKWERSWEEVRYCSERCKREAKKTDKSESKDILK
ncbi:DUF2256 domain-containing protein [Phaeodactylibacter luteus]|uniref:DUF2256 domain-containing protein n=1 Tax=Phaeodactylibacter luteus TaxID=1564516 RepID=A0A5C6RX67_9BACT|nr:DUF2256 domain-containing protein [Phaeodactylibacter luteus]TXB66585.1 DUF2256 domain-containing protein [Phaeodactylibacter luteus]